MEPLRPGDVAPDVPLYATDGGIVSTELLWRDEHCILTFLRHAGCPFARDHLARIRQAHPRFVEAGARIAAVQMGAPVTVGEFCRDRGIPFTCLADPDRSAYGAFGLPLAGPHRWLANRSVIAGSVRLFAKGVAGGLPHPGQDVRQMPGVFVVARGGTIRLAHRATDPSDLPPVDVLLDALGAA